MHQHNVSPVVQPAAELLRPGRPMQMTGQYVE
jgi:hypothetical protein